MVAFERRQRVFVATEKQIDEGNLFRGFIWHWGIDTEQDDVTGEVAVRDIAHKELCDITSVSELPGNTDSIARAWVADSVIEIYNWLIQTADSERCTVQEWLADIGLDDTFHDIIQYGLGRPNIDIDKACSEFGIAIADIFLFKYQLASQEEGIYETN